MEFEFLGFINQHDGSRFYSWQYSPQKKSNQNSPSFLLFSHLTVMLISLSIFNHLALLKGYRNLALSLLFLPPWYLSSFLASLIFVFFSSLSHASMIKHLWFRTISVDFSARNESDTLLKKFCVPLMPKFDMVGSSDGLLMLEGFIMWVWVSEATSCCVSLTSIYRRIYTHSFITFKDLDFPGVSH